LLPEMPLFLTQPQLQHLWESIIESDCDRFGNPLLQIPQTARRALQAHQLLIRYSAEFGLHEAAEDHKAFLRWRNVWHTEARVNGWHDPVEIPWLLAEEIPRGNIPLPEVIIYAGFDEMTPDLQHLNAAIQQCGVTIIAWHPRPCRDVSRLRIAADDAADEVSRCARWIRSLLNTNPAVKIGVVAPQLESYRPLIERSFMAELEPLALVTGAEMPSLFNLSLGQGLDREGVVHAALKLLRVATQIDQDEISWLLRTPYLGQAIEEFENRAQADRELRRMRRFAWTLPALVKALASIAGRSAIAVPGFTAKMTRISADLRKTSRHLPGYWAEHFTGLLHELGWPGERALSSREYQAVEHFRNTLTDLASLDVLSRTLDRSAAVSLLVRLNSNLEFQPQGTDGPVQVLGALESSGMTFEHLWILGLHDAALPSSPSPNPFIPLPTQRRHKMSRSDAEREHDFATRIAARLFSAAPEVMCSWPARDKGADLRPSPFLSGWPDGRLTPQESGAAQIVLCLARPNLEEVNDFQGPRLTTRKPFTGGTGIIRDQALCPFRAFAHHRLRAERLDAPEIGIDAISRGSLVHTVLELFWEATLDQDVLRSLDESDLTNQLEAAVAGALARLEKEQRFDLPPRQRQIEQKRLISLSRQWLDIEKRRGHFRVLSAEKPMQIKVGDLAIRTRVDRIDELDDGTCAVIDYKTGRADPLQWLEDRITEPQLPIYCLGRSCSQVGAVMYAVVRSKAKESGFSGLARNMGDWPGARSRTISSRLAERGWDSFENVLEHWRTSLPALGDAFVHGVAVVDPVDVELACRYCDLMGLCRILEQQSRLQEVSSD